MSLRPILVLCSPLLSLQVLPRKGHNWKTHLQIPYGCPPNPSPFPWATSGSLWMFLACSTCAPEPSAHQDAYVKSPHSSLQLPQIAPSPEQGRSSAQHCQCGRSPQDLLCGAELRADRWSHMGKLITFFIFVPGHL